MSGESVDVVMIRPFDPKDLNYIYASWLREIRRTNFWLATLEAKVMNQAFRPVIRRLIGVSNVAVACLRDDPHTIVGYAVFDNDLLHWVFVKDVWRGFGIAHRLVPKEVTRIHHVTKFTKFSIQRTKD